MTTLHESSLILFDTWIADPHEAQTNTCRLACVPKRPSLVLLTRAPDRCCSDLIDRRRIEVLHVLYSVYFYL